MLSFFWGKKNKIKKKTGNDSKTLKIFSLNQETGENDYILPAKIEGEQFNEVVFNWRYLIDGIKPIKSNDVFLGVNGDSKPALLKVKEDNSWFYVLMPIKNS